MNKTIHIILLTFVLFAFQKEAFMQEGIKLVTRKSEKTFAFNSKYGQVIIEAEKGIINFQSWDRDEVSVKLTLSAKNSNPETANRELDYVHYNLVRDRGNVFLNNKMIFPEGNKEISSVLTARYDIWVPEGTNLKINNKFGSVTALGIRASVMSGDLKYCDMLLKDFKGIVNLTISIGDLNCLQSELEGSITSRHANIYLDEITGKLTLQTRYGSLDQKYGSRLVNLSINSYATDILIDNRACHGLEINLSGAYCPLFLTRECFTPDKKLLHTSFDPSHSQLPWILLYSPVVKSPRLKINAEFGKIKLL